MAKIGLIGTGLMGLPMAQRLIETGHALTVYNRSREKVNPLATAGATIADTPADAIAVSDWIVLMVTNAAAIRETILTDAARSHLAGRTIVQMSTIAPHESQAIRDEVVTAGGTYLEAPVLGSIPEAKAGTLIVMVGSEAEQFDRALPILQALGPNPTLVGPVGTAATVKLALNQLIGSLTSAFAASLGLMLRQNVDPEAFMAILRQSALYAPTFDKKLQRMLDRDYTHPNFPTKHLKKDIDLFITTAQQNQLQVENVEGVQAILAQALQQGWAEGDYAALFSTVCPDV